MDLAALSEAFLRHETVRGCAALTVRGRKSHLGQLAKHLAERGVTSATDLAPEHLEAFAEELAFSLSRSGSPRVERTRNGILTTAKLFCRWLVEHDYVAIDAGAVVAYVKEPHQLPRGVPSEEEVLRLLAAPDSRNRKGFRDRTILELLYATAVRVRELVRLDVGEVDLVHGFALVRGKGGRDRMVPLGKRAASTVESYIAGVRVELAASSETALIVSCRGRRLSTEAVERLVRWYAAGVGLRLTPHLLRHACATHMMRRGANLRHVQELLGHKDITTTEVYTKLTQKELMAAHAAFHPRSKAEVAPDAAD